MGRLRTAAWLLAVIAVACGDSSAPPPDGVIRVAAVGPITGPQAEVGQDLINGVRLAVEQTNSAGGIGGRRVELVVMDDAADPKQAVSVAQKIVADPGIVAVVGHMNSGTTKASSAVYHAAGMPVVMPVPTNPEITEQGFENLFRIPPTDLDQGSDLARFAIKTLAKRRIAIIHDSTDYGQPLSRVFKATVEAEGAGALVVSFDGISEGDRDFRALLTRVKGLTPDALFFAGIYNEGGLIARQARDLGIAATFLAADGSFGDRFLELAGPASAGAVMSFIAPPEESSPSTKAFADAFRAKYGAIRAFAPLGYDAFKTLAEVLASGASEHRAIIERLHSDQFKHEGITGRIKFDAKGNNTGRHVYFYTVTDGRFAPYR